eukprot:969098-Amphidinium_carterae.1
MQAAGKEAFFCLRDNAGRGDPHVLLELGVYLSLVCFLYSSKLEAWTRERVQKLQTLTAPIEKLHVWLSSGRRAKGSVVARGTFVAVACLLQNKFGGVVWESL